MIAPCMAAARPAPDAGLARGARALGNPALIRAVRRRLCGVRGGIMVTARQQGERMFSGWSFRGTRAWNRIAAGAILSAGVLVGLAGCNSDKPHDYGQQRPDV